MLRKSFIFIMILSILVSASACAIKQQEQGEMSEDEIRQVLKDVVGGEQAVDEAGIRYFSQLTNEDKNIIESKKLQEAIEADPESIFILDIRNEKDYKEGHIKGAKNVWWFDVGKNIDMLPKDKPIVVCCYTGQSAGQVVGVLKVMGYNTSSLLGGMNNGWKAEKLPLVSENGAVSTSDPGSSANINASTSSNSNKSTNTNNTGGTSTDATTNTGTLPNTDKSMEDVSNDVS